MSNAIAAGSQNGVTRASDYIGYMVYAYMSAGDFEAASRLYSQLADITGDESYRQSADSLRNQYMRDRAPLDSDAGS